MDTIPAIHDYWIPKKPGARYPDDSVVIHSITVAISPQGGGFVRKIPLADFLANFSRVADDAKNPDYRLAFFSFDEGPTLLGWTAGDRWNGWGCPLLERSCLERYLAQYPWDQLYFEGDDLIYRDENYGPEEQTDPIKPQIIRVEGLDFKVYAFGGLGLCWNQTDPEDAADDPECAEAFAPPGIANPIPTPV